MNPTKTLSRIPTPMFNIKARESPPNVKLGDFRTRIPLFLHTISSWCDRRVTVDNSLPAIASDVSSGVSHNPEQDELEKIEVKIEKLIYGCRFFAILAVWGSLIGSFLCFFKIFGNRTAFAAFDPIIGIIRQLVFLVNLQKGCVFVVTSFRDYFVDRGKVIASLVEATDVYLLGTVMLVFGMGLYELFISNLDKANSMSSGRSNLFGLFTLKGRPRWLEITSVNELKTKLGHVIVMLLLIGLFDKSKKAAINTPTDLLCFSASVLLSSGCLFLLSKLHE